MPNKENTLEKVAPPEGVTPPVDVYEPPAIESVLTADELAREVQYAGGGSGPPG